MQKGHPFGWPSALLIIEPTNSLVALHLPGLHSSGSHRTRRPDKAKPPSGIFFAPMQKGHPSGWPSALFDVWQFPTLAWGDPTLPSALRRFTSEFGMGSGGTTALLPPDKFFSNLPNFNRKSGADTQSRTGDLTLTKGALYQLSHISTLNLMPGSL